MGSQKTRKDNVVFPWLHLRNVKLKLQQKQQLAGLSLKIHFGGPKGGKRGRRRRFWATSIVSPSQKVKKKYIFFSSFQTPPLRKKMTINGPAEHFLGLCLRREKRRDGQNV
jgi:hypothetical protein